jgi:polysaccharide export outer membrane protein
MRNNFIIFIFILPVFFSCVNTKKTMYFANLQDSTIFNEIEAPEYVIQRNDLLSITVSSIDPDASQMFNMTNRSEARTSTPTGEILESSGYLVNRNGYIRFVALGLIKAEGLSKGQLAENIRKEISDRKLLVDPVIEIRHLNYKVTVLGEVNRPTVITVPDEKITLLEALGIAGDLTIFAKRTNVLVIRTEGGKRLAKRIDLNSNNLLNSAYYNLKPNDVVYIEPNKAKVMSATRLNQVLPAIVSGLSVLVVVIDRLTR